MNVAEGDMEGKRKEAEAFASYFKTLKQKIY